MSLESVTLGICVNGLLVPKLPRDGHPVLCMELKLNSCQNITNAMRRRFSGNKCISLATESFMQTG